MCQTSLFAVIILFLPALSMAGKKNKKNLFRLGSEIKILTQNLYVGANLLNVLNAEPPQDAPEWLPESLYLSLNLCLSFPHLREVTFTSLPLL
jgi:hypothetical protein